MRKPGPEARQRPPLRVLILSSTEALPIARAVHTALATSSTALIEPTVWDQAGFSGWLLADVLATVVKYPFVVLVLSPDDTVVTRGVEASGPRDNLLLELGMALATNGPDYTFVLSPVELKLPTDLGGLILRHYTNRSDHNWPAAVAPGCAEIVEKITIRLQDGISMGPLQFKQAVDSLDARLMRAPNRYKPDILIGVNHGGAIVGSMLYYRHRQVFQLMVLWIDVYTTLRPHTTRRSAGKRELEAALRPLRSNSEPRICLVDDTLRSGRAMAPALEVVKEVASAADVRIAVVLYRPDMAREYDPTTIEAQVITPDLTVVPFGCFDRIFYE